MSMVLELYCRKTGRKKRGERERKREGEREKAREKESERGEEKTERREGVRVRAKK